MGRMSVYRDSAELVERHFLIPSAVMENGFIFYEDGIARYAAMDGEEVIAVVLPGIPASSEWLDHYRMFQKNHYNITEDTCISAAATSGVGIMSLAADICGYIDCVPLEGTPYMVYISDTCCAILEPGAFNTACVLFGSKTLKPRATTNNGCPRLEEFIVDEVSLNTEKPALHSEHSTALRKAA